MAAILLLFQHELNINQQNLFTWRHLADPDHVFRCLLVGMGCPSHDPAVSQETATSFREVDLLMGALRFVFQLVYVAETPKISQSAI